MKKTVKRLWISSVTDKAIKDGFSNLKSGKNYENLYASAVARSEADWFVGMNATRALTTKYNAQLSCGRVQTPTLAIIAKREEEIRNFKPKPYFGITASTKERVKLVWQDNKTKDTKTFNKELSDELLKILASKEAEVVSVEKKKKQSFSPMLYDLTELQRDANKRFGFSAKETLSIMQKLYEQHKVLTYPRTDSRHLSTDIVDTIKDRLRAISVGPYVKLAGILVNQPIKPVKSFVDNSKVSDHHAIIPTEDQPSLRAFSDKERKIYDLVVKRFLAVLYPPHEYEQTSITTSINNETFIAKGKIVLSQGWKEVYDNQFEEDENSTDVNQTLPVISKGDKLSITSITQTKGSTQPPAPFNEGTLLSAMENPAKYMANEDKSLIQTIGQTGGLGTVATRADIIEKLFNSFLIEKRGKDIFVTSKGKQLLELVPEDLRSPSLTAELEQKLEAISKGTLNKDTFIQEMKSYAKTVVHQIKNSEKKFKHDNVTGTKCPECSKLLLEVSSKKGKMLVCQDRECGYRKGKSKVTNARCPKCKKKLELRGEGEGQTFACVCGHREKLSSFNARKEKEKGSKASKRDVNKYLKKQPNTDEEPFNPALAEALAKLNLKK